MAARDAIMAAIREGAPLYNAGNPEACKQKYIDTALRLLDSPGVSAAEADALRAAAQQAVSLPSPDDGAWAMRRAFDSILDGSVALQAARASLAPGATEFTVLDFSPGLPDVPRCFAVDDTVMGGMSSSGLSHDAGSGAAVFAGDLSTGGGGGFASVRWQPWAGFALGPARAVRLMVQGDGRTYKLNAKADNEMDGVMYQHDFETSQGGGWQQVDLPLAGFKPNFRGRMLPGRPPLRGDQVRQMGIMVSKFSDTGGLTPGFRAGRFRLALKWIKGVL